MSIFTRYAMDALMKTSHPEINRRQCWNLHPHRTPCTACKDICPYGDEIFTRPNLVKDWDPCTDCGLCVSACRSGCIAPSPEQVQRDTAPADSDNDTVWIGCEKSTRKNTLVRACVSALSWEALAYLALNKKIVLDLTPCGECENDVCAEHLRNELTRLVEFFGQPLFEARFTLAYELDDAPFHVKEYSRREMMEQVTAGSKAGTKQLLRMLPGLRNDDDSSVDFRLMLHQRTKQLKAVSETPLKYGYHLPNFTQKCFACGRCEKSCRAGALKFEDLPDGQTRAVITPWKCSECGVCVATCSNGGLDGLKLRQLTTLGPVSIYKCTKTLCKECGKPIAPNCADGTCSVCRIKIRTKKRQEEAVARAKERQAEREAKRAAEQAAKDLSAEVAAEEGSTALPLSSSFLAALKPVPAPDPDAASAAEPTAATAEAAPTAEPAAEPAPEAAPAQETAEMPSLSPSFLAALKPVPAPDPDAAPAAEPTAATTEAAPTVETNAEPASEAVPEPPVTPPEAN